jgi:ssDNA-binding Zn-finger/Zn-ribbon topoisomerase 1
MNVRVKCPRCGSEQLIKMSDREAVRIVSCDPYDDNGGCGGYFAVRFWIEPQWETTPVDFPSDAKEEASC